MAFLDFLRGNSVQSDESTYVAPQYQQHGLLGNLLAGLQRPIGQAQQQVGGLLGPVQQQAGGLLGPMQQALWGQASAQQQPSPTGYQGYQPMGGAHHGGIGNMLKLLMGG